MTPEDGSQWIVGTEAWAHNPAHIVPDEARAFVRLWFSCRGGMGGIAHWPDAGGVADQAAWVVDAFALLGGTAAAWDEAHRKRTES